MSTAQLSDLTNAELSEVFAVEVVGWKRHDDPACMAKKQKFTMPEKWAMRPDGELAFNHDMHRFADSADAVMPYITEKAWAESIQWMDGCVPKTVIRWRVRVMVRGSFVDGIAPTFARAAVIALIAAKRAEKEAGK